MITPVEFSVETRDTVMSASVTQEAVIVRIAPGSYATSSRRALAGRIGEIGALVGTHRESRAAAALSERYGVYLQPERLAIGARATAYRDLRDRLPSRGGAADALVQVTTRGLVDWQVEVSAEVPQFVSEQWFLDAAGTALTAAVREHLDALPLVAAQVRTGASSADVARARELFARARSR